MRRISASLAAALVAVFLCPLPGRAATRADQWRAIAEQALARAEQLDNGAQRTSTYAAMAQGVWRLYGWQDPRIATLLTTIYSQVKPDGGYGINIAYDALSDGTTNPVDTTYTVTLAGHVGPLLLDGFKAGIVPREKVQSIVNLLWTTPRIAGSLTTYGQCVAYSRNANDAVSYGCVHNVNAGVARFLSDTIAAGITHSGAAALVVDLVRRETYAYRPSTDDWLYMDTRAVNDVDHNSYSAESMYQLVPPVGAEVAYQMMIKSYDDPLAAVVYTRLTGLPETPGRAWCSLGDQWIPTVQAYLTAQANDAGRQAQIAWYAAAAAQNCEEG